jgi:hypothetical protein
LEIAIEREEGVLPETRGEPTAEDVLSCREDVTHLEETAGGEDGIRVGPEEEAVDVLGTATGSEV